MKTHRSSRSLGGRRHLVELLLIIALWLQAPPSRTAWAAEIAVDQRNLAGQEEGTPLRPFTKLQAAIEAAIPGDTIQVAQGTYQENIVVADKSLRILGGFPGASSASYAQGAEGSFSTRDPAANVTVIQGSAATATVLLVQFEGALAGTVLDGFWIRGGRHGVELQDNTWPLSLSAVTISNNTIEENGAAEADGLIGGGIAVGGTEIKILHNVIRKNQASRGAGIGIFGAITNLLVHGNLVEENIGHGDHGGGIYLAGTSVVTSNIVQRNVTGRSVGYGWGGGILIFNEGSVALLAHNIVRENFAPSAGGGVFVDDGARVKMTNELIYKNSIHSEGQAGVGIYVDGYNQGQPGAIQSHLEAVNCTVAHNIGPSATGNGLFLGQSTATVKNCIFWGNGSGTDFLLDLESDVSLDVSYSLTQTAVPGVGNLHQDPLFADPAKGHYHLRSQTGRWDPAAASGLGGWVVDEVNSPALDAGDPASPFDLEPLPNGERINLGADGNSARASKSSADPGQAPSRLEFLRFRISGAGLFESEIQITPGQRVTISASDDLRNWQDVYTGPASGSVVMFEEATAGVSHRFYRARVENE